MLWADYYDKIGEWATSTAVNRISQLESLGPPEEILEAIADIAFHDTKGANRLLKKAVAAGVIFSGEQLFELYNIFEPELVTNALKLAESRLTTADLDMLYGSCDDDVLLDIAARYHIKLPECLVDYEEEDDCDFDEEPAYEEPVIIPPSREELAADLNYILSCLHTAYSYVDQAYTHSLIDISSSSRAFTVTKYALLEDAQSHVMNALRAWAFLDIPNKAQLPLDVNQLHVGLVTMWQNFSHDGLLTNWIVKNQIRSVRRNLRYSIILVRAQLNSL